MTQYINKSVLVTELKRRIKEIDEIGTYLSPKGILTNLLCHINTLEVQEMDLTPTVYVVTRCEEHSDYVEQVFLDENRAIEYCKQFEGANEYGRDITKIEVTL